MEAASPAQQGQYTILRIKRKRNEEPLDALVVEDKIRRKKTKGVGVFQYAQTVEDSVWGDARSHKEIQDTISKLSMENPVLPIQRSLGTHTSQPPAFARQGSPQAQRRQYTIIEVDQNMSPTKQTPGTPAQGILSGGVEPQDEAPDFKMFDVVATGPAVQEEPDDPEMVKFQNMLSDYLKFNDIDVSSPPPVLPAGSPITVHPSINDSRPKPPQDDDDGDYVWDVFFHRPTTLSEWNDLANVGMLSSFPTSLFDDDYDDDSESEIEDEADEDSNAEEYYRNDYPDEEDDDDIDSPWDTDSDEFHERSEYEEDLSRDSDS
ncbi:hypothetical protein NMY22_g984 [Coprinellus aureogranulatus]|nr:hypothetical protein NMY22_g984 [Coprinellus aureogranulatus]